MNEANWKIHSLKNDENQAGTGTRVTVRKGDF